MGGLGGDISHRKCPLVLSEIHINNYKTHSHGRRPTGDSLLANNDILLR